MLKRIVCISLILLLAKSSPVLAQCGGGYTQALLNWDYLDYYYNSGGSNPYGSYISDVREQTQKFAIGTTWLSIATSSNALVTTSENASHTGEVSGYTGEDVQYNPSANSQTITITFNAEVTNVQFTLYDVDRQQRIDFAAQNAGGTGQTINVVTYASTILTVTNNNATNAYITASNTALANNTNQGSATITVAGPVKTITITITTIGSDAVFWLSDIYACVTGSFPTNWHQGFNNQPFSGFTQNQPDYFLVTPDDSTCFMVDPATGNCWYLFTDGTKNYLNSFAYDPQNKYLYYISENATVDANNKTLKRYDFNTETISTVISDIGTTLGIPTFNAGVESAGAFMYNGYLYLGIEGGQSTSTIRESIVWCVDLANNNAYQVWATPSYNASSFIHDWADFILKDGTLINYNSAKNGSSYSSSSYTHYNLMTGAATVYNNPDGNNKFAGQAGMTWAGGTYMAYDSLWTYSTGTISSRLPFTVITVPGSPAPPAWVGNAGDASDPFRPKCDFGDAPATYDPNAQMPAVHERSEAITIGSTWDREWLKRGTSGTDDEDDGLATVPVLVIGPGSSYAAEVTVYNNNGSNATLLAWLDYNGNGVFDASEACTPITVSSSGSTQTFWLSWSSTSNSFTEGATTYLRIRMTSASAGMTSSHATGYFTNGEVEDYIVYAYSSPLSAVNLEFNAEWVAANRVQLNWSAEEEPGLAGYELQKSANGADWTPFATIGSQHQQGVRHYAHVDNAPYSEITYYRLRLLGANGKYSDVRLVRTGDFKNTLTIWPNPARGQARITVQSAVAAEALLTLSAANGQKLLEKTVKLERGRNDLLLPLEGSWTSGTYFVRITVNGDVIREKLLIQK
ncbi:MAG TPA: GEVED domain-containing protein [Chitinophagaceae bacterium]|nr:GEVED domain-containing protein [Chitinophagaceae bacterium]